MASLNFAMWNCSGFLSSSSAEDKLQFIETSVDFDVLILIETHHKKMEDITPFFQRYSTNYTFLHTSATIQDPFSGIVALVSNNVKILESNILLPGRLLNFKIKNAEEEHNISVMYGFSGNAVSLENVSLFVEGLSQHHATSENNIILGDFNFVDSDLDRTSQNGPGKNQADRRVGDLWTGYLDQAGLADPFRVRNPKRRWFSYIHTQHNSKSRLDRVYVNEENCNDIFHYKHILQSLWPKAHRIVSFVLRNSIERGPGFWKMNVSILPDQAYASIVESTVNDVLALNIRDPIQRWLVFIETIRIETRFYCSRKKNVEQRIKILCQRKIEELEQNPSLSSDCHLQSLHNFYLDKLDGWHKKKIEGYQVRIKTQPRFEYGEPQISFFADLEKKSSKKKVISHLQNEKGETVYDTGSIKSIAKDYYSKLFDAKPSGPTARKLLSNIHKKLTPEQRQDLDLFITKEEVLDAVMKLNKNKSPGPDGIPIEFYQVFWPLFHDMYFDFLVEVKRTALPIAKNVSITTLIYKERGDIFLLSNYRPIALMNVDVKILTKVLSMRLIKVLPTIIHESQTAIFGRRIGDNIHLVRDLIDYANENNEGAALLFLDQEKAFDRVSHEFLYNVLNSFGFGNSFIHWIQLLYSNASTRINVNGFLTDRIALKSGVRQGCPLSALLYVMVIEILALQLRANPNIIGFTIQGQKIISSHYSDDAVIKITQNQCFKEVYKELKDYEIASGARVNYEKTKGLWLGKWRDRCDDPFAGLYEDNSRVIKWTNKNVKNLGIFVGNDNPDLQTFNEIAPKIKKRLNFWKPLRLPILAKARVIEIFHASKLFFAANFYPLPLHIEEDIMSALMNYITFPKKMNEVSRMEMEKLRASGGVKLINIGLKAQTPKIHWLMRLITEESLSAHRCVFNALIGTQPGHLTAEDLIFAEQAYITRCRIRNSFYNEALHGMAKLRTLKYFANVNDEHLFYNPVFTTSVGDEVHDRTITHFRGNSILSRIRTYGDLLHAAATVTQQNLLAAIGKKKESIHHILDSGSSHSLISLVDGEIISFKSVSQMLIYSDLIYEKSRDHGYETKWVSERFALGLIDWPKVWESVHNNFHTEDIKSTIWEQIHLNFYTTFNYNKWHKSLHPCPLCRKIPDDVFHIIFDCMFTKVMWRRLAASLYKIFPHHPTIHEMAFGLQPSGSRDRNAVILRNWVTFSLRNLIMSEERRAYHANQLPSVEGFFLRFNLKVKNALKLKMTQYLARGLSKKFCEIVTINGAIATLINGEYFWKDVM